MLNILADSLLVATFQSPIRRPPLNPDASRPDAQADKRQRRGWLALMGLHL